MAVGVAVASLTDLPPLDPCSDGERGTIAFSPVLLGLWLVYRCTYEDGGALVGSSGSGSWSGALLKRWGRDRLDGSLWLWGGSGIRVGAEGMHLSIES